MRTLVRHAVLAASVAVVALACGSSDNKQPNTPSSSTEYNQAQYPQPQTSQPQQGSNDNTTQGMSPGDQSGTGSTIGSGGPQKPFYGPGLDNPDQAGTATTNEGSMQAKQVTNLSDGDIFAIEDAANNGEIQMAELAKKQGVGAQTKDFAAMMITHHRDAENKLKALAKKQNITSKDNDVSNKLKGDVSSMITDMRAKKGKEFDRLYMDNQVKAHRDVLDIVDNQLIPSVQNADLKTHLSEVRRTVADHLQKAEDIQAKMQPTAATETTGGTAKGKSTTTTTKSKAKGTTPAKPDTKPACDTSIDPDCDGDVHPTKKSDKNDGTKQF
jgi:putative membrane protein